MQRKPLRAATTKPTRTTGSPVAKELAATPLAAAPPSDGSARCLVAAKEIVEALGSRPRYDRRREKEGEAGRRLPLEAQREAGGDRRARARDAGKDRQGLGEAYEDGVLQADRPDGTRMLGETVGKEEQGAEKGVARLGGDEFAVLVPEIESHEDIEEIATRLEHSFDRPIMADGVELQGSASIGMALYPQDGVTRDDLLRVADAAMYGVKRAHHQAWAEAHPTEGPAAVAAQEI